MADTYDVSLGQVGDEELTGYMLQGGPVRGVTRFLVNPYATKIGAGDREFADDTAHDYWTVRDWTKGFGHKNPEEGYLYGHIDSRFPGQACLPLEPEPPSYNEMPYGGSSYAPGSVTLHSESVDDETLPSRWCSTFRNTNDTVRVAHQVAVKIKAPIGSIVTASIWTLSAGRYPLTQLSSGVGQVLADRPVAEYIGIDMPPTDLEANTEYGLVVQCNNEAVLYNCHPHRPGGLLSTVGRLYYPALGYWANHGYTFQFAINFRSSESYLALQDGDYLNLNLGDPDLGVDGDWFITNEFQQRLVEFAKANQNIYSAWGTYLDRWDKGERRWVNVYDTGGPQMLDIMSLDDKIYIALGADGYAVYDPVADSVTTHAEVASMFYQWKGDGYLWRVYDNELWYTADGATWEGPFQACRDPYQIRGMAGMGNLVYFACDDGLYILEYGDLFVRQVAKWPSIDARNGAGMISWLGNLYIPLAEDLVQYAPSGVMLQMGLRVGEGLPKDMQGRIFSLHGTNYFLLAMVDPAQGAGPPSLWAYNNSGWHNILRLPQGSGAGAMYLDTETDYLWIGSGRASASRSTYPPSVVNPIRDFENITFAREGWVEFDEFNGRLAELLKDGESVYVNSEFVSGLGEVSIYWKADDETEWQLLGTVGENHRYVRWSNYDVRPAFKTIRLGFAIRTDQQHSSPVLRAHVLKYLAISNDRYGWQLNIIVSDFMEDQEGNVNAVYDDREEKRSILDSLERNTPPVLYRDIDGKEYEARVTAGRRDVTRYQMDADGNRKFDTVHSLTLEQVVPEEYEG